MCSTGASLQALQQRVSQLPKYENMPKAVQNSLIYDESKTREILKALKDYEKKNKSLKLETKLVYLDRVYTTQSYLYEERLKNYADKPIHELAEGYLYNGDVLITDGNHRIALAKLNNQKSARMRVMDLNKKPSIIKKLIKRKRGE